MPKSFYDFVFWLEYRHGLLTNRQIINDYYNILISMMEKNNFKINNLNFKNQFVAFLYEHSLSSDIKKSINNSNTEPPPDIFYFKYEPYFNDFFDFIKKDIDFNLFNILDSNQRVQRINFLDLIENNIEILDDIQEEDDELSEHSDYDNFY